MIGYRCGNYRCKDNIYGYCKPINYDSCIFTKKQNKKNPCQFKVPSPLMIDKKEIQNSLTRKQPLLFLEYNNKICVHVHQSIIWKADILGIKNILPVSFESNFALLKNKWIKWVKDVKSTEWGNKKKETIVNMIFPKI